MNHLRFYPFVGILLVMLLWPSGSIRAQEGQPPANCIFVEQNGGFETSEAWQFADTASPGFLDSTHAHSGQQSAFVGISEDAENQAVDSTVWQSMQLPQADQITATLWMRSQPGDGDDKRYVVAWDLANDESTVLLYEQVPEEDWREFSIDLSPFAGGKILFVVGVHNDGQGKKAGVWVDDVRVMACDLATATPEEVDTPEVVPTVTATPIIPTATSIPTDTPTATTEPTLTSTATAAFIPTTTPTATSTPRPTQTPTATASPTSTSTPTTAPKASPPQSRGTLPDNSALPLLAAIFVSGLVALIAVFFNLRH